MSLATVSILRHPKTTVLSVARQLGYTGADDKMTAAEWVCRTIGRVEAFEKLAGATQPVTQPRPITATIQAPVPAFKADPVFVPVPAVDQKLMAIESAVQTMAAQLRTVEGLAVSAGTGASNAQADIRQIQQDTAMATNRAMKITADHVAQVEAGMKDALAQVIAQLQARPAPVVDPAAVAAEVSAAVAQAFKPFAQAVSDAGAEAAVGNLSAVSIVRRETAKSVFGVTVKDSKGNPVMVDIWDHPGAPAVDPTFIWSKAILQHLLLSQSTGENIWFGGDKGTGKSETARQFAARTGRGFTRINFHKYSASEDYLGATGLQAGSTQFEPQAFLKAYVSPSTVILLDEVTNADPGNLAPLNGLLEPGAAVSIGGMVWRRAPGVLCFAADNTLGSGDQSGRYAGTRDMNSSLIDRFSRIVKFEFLSVAQEVEAVVRHTGCAPELAKHIIEAVNICRQKVATGDIVDAPSIRSVIGFIRALQMMPVADAWQSTIAARQPAESALALEAIRTASINETLIQSLV
jgi:MoxR-like ATPase